MKINTVKKRPGLFRFFVLALLLTVFFASCSKKVNFAASSIVPAAQGYVKTKKDNNGNYSIYISLTNLASPKRLQPPRETYVAWIETADRGIKNVGQLKSESGIFTSTLEATLSTVTSFKPIRVFITAEDQPDLQHPGTQTVLDTSAF